MPLNINFSQIFLHMFNFTLLFAILYYLLYKPVKDFMAKREAHYARINAEAEAHMEDALRQKEEYKSLLQKADKDILEQKQKVRIEMDDIYTKRVKQAEEDAAKILMTARQDAEREKAAILESAQTEISEMVTSAAEKLVLSSSASDAFDQFLNAAEGGEAGDTIYQ
ncbi:MAG: ATP synthase F0 subunit B [Firmicutes bacterium]|nr:ATP synthase F0 subunit B [Bacillota bacterium]